MNEIKFSRKRSDLDFTVKLSNIILTAKNIRLMIQTKYEKVQKGLNLVHQHELLIVYNNRVTIWKFIYCQFYTIPNTFVLNPVLFFAARKYESALGVSFPSVTRKSRVSRFSAVENGEAFGKTRVGRGKLKKLSRTVHKFTTQWTVIGVFPPTDPTPLRSV